MTSMRRYLFFNEARLLYVERMTGASELYKMHFLNWIERVFKQKLNVNFLREEATC
jgi:hypothetical protein